MSHRTRYEARTDRAVLILTVVIVIVTIAMVLFAIELAS